MIIIMIIINVIMKYIESRMKWNEPMKVKDNDINE